MENIIFTAILLTHKPRYLNHTQIDRIIPSKYFFIIMADTLESIVRQHVPLGRPNPHGWYPVLCKVCGDHGRKGKRGGFRFDGQTCSYNCFNCAHAAGYDPSKDASMPAKMVAVLNAFGIPQSDWNQVVFANLNKQTGSTQSAPGGALTNPKPIHLPSYFTPLVDVVDTPIAQEAIDFLKVEKSIDWDSYPFFIGTESSHPDAIRWYARLIIPIFFDQSLVYFEGRDLTNTRPQKYLGCSYASPDIIYGYEHLYDGVGPLFITEGWFDAYHLNGVAVFANKMTPVQISRLKTSNRQKVVVPDKGKSGKKLALQAIHEGWGVAFPDFGNATDVTAAITKYGKLYVLRTITDTIVTGDDALLQLGLWADLNDT